MSFRCPTHLCMLLSESRQAACWGFLFARVHTVRGIIASSLLYHWISVSIYVRASNVCESIFRCFDFRYCYLSILQARATYQKPLCPRDRVVILLCWWLRSNTDVCIDAQKLSD
ncbi:unnamed protein product [Periconia digitata]|uniref:Uncharacterized protein n=1 Tax=Periconia digitata TaxID=1303443 RepID=A0A9W4XEK2_9PLEO|nr:unnamed protein product [Periconia digitata]